MKVLYIPIPTFSMHPWYDDFMSAVDGRYPVELYDFDKPLAEQFQGIDVVVELGGAVADQVMIDAGIAAGVKLWQVSGTGLDHVDVAYFLEKGMTLANTPGPFSSVALAEHVMFLMLYFSKKYNESQKNVRSQVFNQPMTEDLEGKTLGLVGFGASARELARRAWPFEMKILAVDVADVPQEVCDEFHVEFLGGPQELDRLLAKADYLSLHIPLTSKTRHLIDGRALGLMKPSAVLINVARGGIVDETALIDALRSGRIQGAGLDVFTQEPLDLDNPLLQMENVIVTPHNAGGSRGTSRKRGQACANNIHRIAQSLPPLHQITSVE